MRQGDPQLSCIERGTPLFRIILPDKLHELASDLLITAQDRFFPGIEPPVHIDHPLDQQVKDRFQTVGKEDRVRSVVSPYQQGEKIFIDSGGITGQRDYRILDDRNNQVGDRPDKIDAFQKTGRKSDETDFRIFRHFMNLYKGIGQQSDEIVRPCRMFIQVYRHTDRPPRAKSKHARFYLAGKKPVHVQDVTRNTIAYDKIFRNIEFRQVNVNLHKNIVLLFQK